MPMQTKEEDLEAHRSQGLCSFYIRRFSRFCRKRSGVNPLCSDHAPANLSEIRERTFLQQKTHSADAPKSRRARISSSQKRMMNPLNVGHSSTLHSWIEGLDHDKELMVDVGCARGTLLRRLALKNPSYNYCGLEIRSELVKEATQKAQTPPDLHKRLRYLSCSANASFRNLFGKDGYCDSLACWSRRPCLLHPIKLRLVSILFPDPWKRGKHQRRRVMNAQFVDELAESLEEGAVVYMCSDVLSLATEMRDLLAAHPCFARLTPPAVSSPSPSPSSPSASPSSSSCGVLSLLSMPSTDSGWLPVNPLPAGSERDDVCEVLGREVFRALFQRNGMEAIPTAIDVQSEDSCEECETEDLFDPTTTIAEDADTRTHYAKM